MAKKTKTYPSGYSKVVYETTNLLPSPKRTKGKVQHLPGARYYIKPALGKVIIRKAGVYRRSADVVEINKKLEALKGSGRTPAELCAGKPWDEFVSCLRAEMKKVVGGGA